MTATIESVPDLRIVPLAGLAAMRGQDAELDAAIIAEADRRDKAREAARARRRADPVTAAWMDAAHEQYLAAERECRGQMLSHAGIAAGIRDEFRLWSGPAWFAERYASWELLRYWESHPRLTLTEYRRQEKAGRARWEREREADSGLDSDAGAAIRRETDGVAQGTGTDSDRSRDTVSRAAAGAETAPGGNAPRADAGRGPAFRPSVVPVLTGAAAELHARASARREVAAASGGSGNGTVAPRWNAVTGGRGCRHPWKPAAARCSDCPLRQASPPLTGHIAPGPRRDVPDARELLGKVLEATGLYLAGYVRFPSRAAVIAATLWIAHAAARDESGELIWWATPRLLLTSRQNGSGKSTLLDLIAILLASRSGRMVKVTAYGIAQIVGTHHDVALPDDAQLTFGTTGTAAKDIQAALLGGYSRGGTWVTGKSKGTIEKVFGPAAIAGKDELITKQADALRDLLARSIIIRMERPDRYLPQIDEAAHERGTVIGDALRACMGALLPDLRQAARDLGAEAAGQYITDGDGGRTAQIWRQLEAVARVAGGRWPGAVAEAAAELTAAAGDLLAAQEALNGLDQAGLADGRSFWDEIQ